MNERALRTYSLATLIVNILVILWGAYVRATGAGAGCGSHWPLCDGVVLPRSPGSATIIEYTHRVTSGVALLMVLGLMVWTRRRLAAGHAARVYATWAMVFIVLEALIGAGLVLFELVAYNTSVTRAVVGALHLLNTFLLLGSIVAVREALGELETRRFVIADPRAMILLAGMLGILLVGMSGAVTALGDTLFPSNTLLQGVIQELSDDAHFLLRLRVWHPFIALLASALILLGLRFPPRGAPASDRTKLILITLLFTQLLAGLVNVLLLAPIWLQIIHLFLADLIWVTLIMHLFKTQRMVPFRRMPQDSKIS